MNILREQYIGIMKKRKEEAIDENNFIQRNSNTQQYKHEFV